MKINPPGAIVKKVLLNGHDEISCIQFFDRNGNKLLQAGTIFTGTHKNTIEFVLRDGERLIGVKSKLNS